MRLYWQICLRGTTGLVALATASCASPPLTLFSLADTSGNEIIPTYGPHPLVIQIARVGLPDELDNEDILLRDGNILRRSSQGRWATRLSMEITALITRHLADQRPDALVTDRPQFDQPTYRLTINISRLTVTSGSIADAVADWQILPRDDLMPLTRYHAHVTESGPVATDAQVVALDKAVVGKLADAISLRALR